MISITKRRIASVVPASAIVATLALTITAGATLAAPQKAYDNGFEKVANAATPATSDTNAMFNVTRVEKTKDLKSSKGHWYATAGVDAFAFSRLGGYSSTFPTKGYATSVDVYLDMALSTGTDMRFDWSSAISNSPGGHLRDFIFHVGTDMTTPGQFIMSASNNAPGWPANPARDPFTVSESGWYTFQHEFTNVDGVLVVNMSVLDDHHHVLKTWALSTSSDTIGDTGVVGGNRYAWLVSNDFDGLALDEVTRTAKAKH